MEGQEEGEGEGQKQQGRNGMRNGQTDTTGNTIHKDDYQSTTVGELGTWVTDRMVTYGLYRGVTKEVAKFTYRGRDWRLIGRWARKEALISELDYKDETIVYAAFPRYGGQERRKRRMEEGRNESAVSKRGRQHDQPGSREAGASGYER